MSMFPHTVTVYNSHTEEPPETGFQPTLTNYITVLRGVLVDATKASNVRQSGLVSADSVALYIPFDVVAVDGITGEPKKYVGPMEFWRDKQDRAGIWTLSVDGNGGQTFFVQGEVIEPQKTFETISLLHDGVYNVTKVDAKDFGGLPHWEVGGA